MKQQECIETLLRMFITKMQEEGKGKRTVQKYYRDVSDYLIFCARKKTDTFKPESRNAYREYLIQWYQPASANSKLAAVNLFFKYNHIPGNPVKYYRVQRMAFRPERLYLTKQEYYRLLKTAERRNARRLYLLIETMAATGIRVSELEHITVEGLQEKKVIVRSKAKSRVVLVPEKLCRDLLDFAEESGIEAGSVFVTKNGKPMDRSNINRSMKQLCEEAGVDRSKVFCHNLRHLFAVTYYNAEKDIVRLADILGHSNLNTTRIYTAVSYGELEGQIESLGLLPED